ncbi:MAG: endo-1,4-beta-xylanase [Planctomycetota bacterium]
MNTRRTTGHSPTFTCIALIVSAVSANAQDARRPRTQVTPIPEVLNLSDEQTPKFLKIQKAMTTKWAELQTMSPQQRNAERETFFKARLEELEELLTPQQMAQYREIRNRRASSRNARPPARPNPRESNPQPLANSDYSGNDIVGIEAVVDESLADSQPWREQANQRIDRLRKADLEVRVVDADGNPVPGARVQIKQQRHLFRFGGVVSGPSMHASAGGQMTRPDNPVTPEQYKETFRRLGFNAAGFGMYLKYKRRPMAEPHLPGLFTWFQENKIPVRGHCLIWPGGEFGNFMPRALSELVYVDDPSANWSSTTKGVARDELTVEEQQNVRDLCKRMIEEAAGQWPVYEWDVINETRNNHIVQDLVGQDVIADWFKIAKEATVDRDALLYLNENKIISDPASGEVTENMKQFAAEVQYLLDNDAPLSALGFQSRFAKQTTPETIYKRLQYFEKFNLPIAATEFEMKNTIGDELEKAAMTERVMTVLFSHHLVNGIYAWTVLSRASGSTAGRAILEADGRLRLRGKVWMHLMKQRWWTDETLTTDADGKVSLRGFKGDYKILVGGDAVELKLDDDQRTELTSSAPKSSIGRNDGIQPSTIGLAEIEGRNWLITPEGKPFFAHGVTHTTNRTLQTNYNAVSRACRDLGFNAYGYGCPTPLKSDMPYVEGRNYVPNSTYRGNGGGFRFIDVFDPREQQKLTAQVKQSCLQNRENPNLIGYCWTDLGAWPLKNNVGKNWVDFIRGLPPGAPGHQAYDEFLETWKGDDSKARDLGFLRTIAREYFRVMGEANRKHDPHHLIFGDRFAFNTIVPAVLEEMLPWVDAIAIQPPFQPGFPKAKYQEIHELTGKPILICDFAIRFKDGDKSIRGWQLQADARTAGVHYAKYVQAALETPYIIGAFWCNPVDSTPAFSRGALKQGLFGDGLTPRPGLSEAVVELNRRIVQATPHGSDGLVAK